MSVFWFGMLCGLTGGFIGGMAACAIFFAAVAWEEQPVDWERHYSGGRR